MLSRRFIVLLATTGVLPTAGADECLWPSYVDPPAEAAPAADGVAVKGPDELPVQVKSGGGAEVTREGDAKLTGGVTIVQGDRELSADSATYDASERRFEVEGDVEFRSPDVRLKGGTGEWDAQGAGEFTGAEFELPERPARGSAAKLQMTLRG